ncbi:unnamed protein product [Cuscuta europaea]|uniref:Uncharacterized protein n=1 Tax=Cuscuta europaea TaxID=41803 RepID=A0A9P0ZY79_CUSEU|nr:unnamed protein product [Cuscuta europaea]
MAESARSEEKCPNINEKAKKEVHHDKETHGRSGEIDENTPLDEIKGPNVFERAKEEIEAVVEAIHPGKCPNNIKKAKKELHHDKETHGRSGKIDENTPLDEIKGPSVVEVEAVVRAILHGK